MAVSVDTVYQRVLALANKEQRGYITPQEFNLFANQAQMDIFEQYFYDINQFGRVPGNDTGYSDMRNYLEEKINVFESQTTVSQFSGYHDAGSIADLYKIGSISIDGTPCQQVNANRLDIILSSSLTKPTTRHPIYVLKQNKVYVYPAILTAITVNYVKKPDEAEWSGYNIGGAFQYNEGFSTNFELHPSEEPDLVIKVLQLAGITLKDPALYQATNLEDNKNTQQEKQ